MYSGDQTTRPCCDYKQLDTLDESIRRSNLQLVRVLPVLFLQLDEGLLFVHVQSNAVSLHASAEDHQTEGRPIDGGA